MVSERPIGQATPARLRIAGAIAAVGPRGHSATVVIGQGEPGQEIPLAAAELGADLVVIGSRGAGRAAGLLLGSGWRKVAVGSPVLGPRQPSPQAPDRQGSGRVALTRRDGKEDPR